MGTAGNLMDISFCWLFIFARFYRDLTTVTVKTLRHCAISRKVAGSNPDGVTGFFYGHDPSGRTLALGSTQPLTEMSNRNVFWG
jgi:hypothetical protein